MNAISKDQSLHLLRKNSTKILEEVNYEIDLRAHRFSTSFLTDVFRSIFKVEKSLELIEPRIFTVDDDPGQIIFKRLNPFQVLNLPFAISNNEVLCKNYKLFGDIDFALFIDISLSMLYRWSLTKDIVVQRERNEKEIRIVLTQLKQTKLYALKFISCAFLYASIHNSFKINFVPYSSDVLMEKKSQKEMHFPAFVLNFIDEHFHRVYREVMENANYQEAPGLENAFNRALVLKKRSILLFVSDFLDDVEEMKAYLFELKLKHSLLVAVINDPFEVEIPYFSWQPLNKSWEHSKNIEQNIRQRVVLSKANIMEYNRKAGQRRKKLLEFLDKEKIPHLDIITNENQGIPDKLEELKKDILEGF